MKCSDGHLGFDLWSSKHSCSCQTCVIDKIVKSEDLNNGLIWYLYGQNQTSCWMVFNSVKLASTHLYLCVCSQAFYLHKRSAMLFAHKECAYLSRWAWLNNTGWVWFINFMFNCHSTLALRKNSNHKTLMRNVNKTCRYQIQWESQKRTLKYRKHLKPRCLWHPVSNSIQKAIWKPDHLWTYLLWTIRKPYTSSFQIPTIDVTPLPVFPVQFQ